MNSAGAFWRDLAATITNISAQPRPLMPVRGARIVSQPKFSRRGGLLFRGILVGCNITRHLLRLKQVRVSGSQVREHALRDTEAVLHLFPHSGLARPSL